MKHLNETAAAPDGFFFFLTVETEGSRGTGRRFGDSLETVNIPQRMRNRLTWIKGMHKRV
jgi:hypothetical protein